MEYEVIDYRSHNELTKEIAKHGINVYDGNGKEYSIELDKFGRLTISGNDGRLSIEPNVSNVITINTIQFDMRNNIHIFAETKNNSK